MAHLEYVYVDFEGYRYGAWYRVLSAEHLEVMSVGLLQVVPYSGSNFTAAACAALENFVRRRKLARLPIAGGVPVSSPEAVELAQDAHHCERSPPIAAATV